MAEKNAKKRGRLHKGAFTRVGSMPKSIDMKMSFDLSKYNKIDVIFLRIFLTSYFLRAAASEENHF